MHQGTSIFVLILVFYATAASGQAENYIVKKAPMSSDKYDEFSPVPYKGGIVFCSNRNPGLLFSYSTSDNKNLFKIFYSRTLNNAEPELFSQSISSPFNDGPVSFNKTGDTVYFSRNIYSNSTPLNASDPRNKLGIFYAVRNGLKWKNITDLRFNSDSYNVTTPWLSPDGRKLYIASDKPGGYGGSDLYVCEWKNNYWNNPVNLGNTINTKGNEAYPFVNESGELFFSSDGHPGIGRKDIFFSKFVDTAWIEPVGLNPPINSKYDDFGFYSDNDMNEGYFSSRRGSTVDIYSFKTVVPQFLYCSEQKEARLCFRFEDDLSIDIDPLSLQFVWEYGDGKTAAGYVTDHCYSKPGKYPVKQNIVERKTGNVVFSKLAYDLDLERKSVAYINLADEPYKGVETSLTGEISPAFEVLSYQWEFGDGSSLSGKSVKHTYKSNGIYDVKLGIVAKEKSTGSNKKYCVIRKIKIDESMPSMAAPNPLKKELYPEVRSSGEGRISIRYSAAEELAGKAVFQAEVLSSKTRLEPGNQVFSGLGGTYRIKEYFFEDQKVYSYVIDEALTFMDVYPSYVYASGAGFKNARIKTFIPSDPAERVLWNIKRLYSLSADIFFNREDAKLKPGEYTVLEQIAVFLKKNPEIKLEIAGHTDNTALPEMSLRLSQGMAAGIAGYLVLKGIDKARLKPVGYGSTRQIAPNYSEADRKKNRRIDFSILR
jgi:outer membrane protein OmpA-like peptidoglycan-associated protein